MPFKMDDVTALLFWLANRPKPKQKKIGEAVPPHYKRTASHKHRIELPTNSR